VPIKGLTENTNTIKKWTREPRLKKNFSLRDNVTGSLTSIVVGPPARPSNVRLHRQPYNQAVRVEWDGPIWSIHVPVDTYSVEVLKESSSHWLYLDTVRPSSDRVCHYDTDKLEPGVYMFRIIPFNDVGSGPPAISSAAEVD